MTLEQIFKAHKGRQSTKWQHYFEYYDRHLNCFRNTPVVVLEIGIEQGGSLQIWKEYFGSESKIVGIDKDPRTMYSEPQISTELGDQRDTEFLMHVIDKHGRPDVVIDDGSHDQLDIWDTLLTLYPSLNDGGVYVVEDLHTAYWQSHKGGITSPFNFVTIASRFTHDVNKWFIREPFTASLPDLNEISFYNSIVFLKKERSPRPEMVFTGSKLLDL